MRISSVGNMAADKMRSQRGITMFFALILLLLCSVLGTLLLGFARLQMQGQRGSDREEQRRLAAVSAFEVLRPQLLACSDWEEAEQEEMAGSVLTDLFVEELKAFAKAEGKKTDRCSLQFTIERQMEAAEETVPDIPEVVVHFTICRAPEQDEEENGLFVMAGEICVKQGRDLVEELGFRASGGAVYEPDSEQWELWVDEVIAQPPQKEKEQKKR